MIATIFGTSVFLVSLFLIVQASIAIWQMLYAWSHPKQLQKNSIPREKYPAKTRFSLIIPALNESAVIGETLVQLAKQTYDPRYFEVLVVMYQQDLETRRTVRSVKRSIRSIRIRPIIYNHRPQGKPQSLNYALPFVRGDYVGIFDAEDHVHPKLLSVVNTIILRRGRKVIQTGVSLINWRSRWFSLHNVVEYFFWFKSLLQWYADHQLVPLGGVGVLFPKEALIEIGGWDETCLTEDAKIGVDLSVAGYTFDVFANEKYATQEEAPGSISAFIRQRTRWIQGYLQIIASGNWRRLPVKQQLHFLMLFLFPLMKFGLYLWLIFSLLLSPKLPVLLVMFSFAPLTLLFFQLMIHSMGIYEMLRSRKEAAWIAVRAVFIYILSYLPYDLLMSYCAIRAAYRHLTNNTAWEKTFHQNLHRRRLVIELT